MTSIFSHQKKKNYQILYFKPIISFCTTQSLKATATLLKTTLKKLKHYKHHILILDHVHLNKLQTLIIKKYKVFFRKKIF